MVAGKPVPCTLISSTSPDILGQGDELHCSFGTTELEEAVKMRLLLIRQNQCHHHVFFRVKLMVSTTQSRVAIFRYREGRHQNVELWWSVDIVLCINLVKV